MSLLLGAAADGAAKRESLASWLREHAPTLQTWEGTLHARGWSRVTSPETLHRVLRSLPSRLDDPASAWVTRDRHWVALFSGEEPDPIAFAGPGASPAPKAAQLEGAWEPLGRGWPALEALLERPAAFQPVRKPHRTHDPRELIY